LTTQISNHALADELNRLSAAVEANVAETRTIRTSLFGNGRPEHALVTRVHLLEMAEKKRAKILWLTAGCIVALAATSIWRAIF
jgi:hypothetical protein